MTGAELGQAITFLSAQINAANHRLLQMIAEFDRCGGWRLDGSVRSCAHWLVATEEHEGFMVHLAEQNTAGHLERLVSRYEPVAEPAPFLS